MDIHDNPLYKCPICNKYDCYLYESITEDVLDPSEICTTCRYKNECDNNDHTNLCKCTNYDLIINFRRLQAQLKQKEYEIYYILSQKDKK